MIVDNNQTIADLATIVQPSLKDRVVDSIKLAAMRGELRPGQRLKEVGLAKELGVGQATVREALIELEARGFVQKRNRKTFITTLSRSDIDAIYALRLPLEALAVEWLALKEDRDLKGLENACMRMAEIAPTGKLSEFKEADLAFHHDLWAATGNPYLEDALERLVPQLFAYAIVAASRDYQPPHSKLEELTELHRKIVQSIRDQDVPAAKQALAASMDVSWVEGLNLQGRATMDGTVNNS